MFKLIRGIVIGILSVIVGGIILMVGCTAMLGNAVDETVQEMEQESVKLEQLAQDIVDNTVWERYDDALVGKFVNTTGQEIDYLEIEYKFLDANGVTIDSSWTCESDIAPGETREIKIYVFEDFYEYILKVSEANDYEAE